MAEDRIGQDTAETEPAIGLAPGAAGWSVSYLADGAASPASDEDPEALALRLSRQGRSDDAVAFLEGLIAHEKSQAGATPPRQSVSRASKALALITRPSAPSNTTSGPAGVLATALDPAEPADSPGQLLHIAPEPRVDDTRPFRRAHNSRPRWLMAAALLLGSTGLGAAFWPGGYGAVPQSAEPAEVRAALPAERPAQVATRIEASVAPGSAVPVPVPLGVPLEANADEQAGPPAEPAGAARRPSAQSPQFGPPAPEPAQQALAPPGQPSRSASRAPDESAPPQQGSERPVEVARLPNPRPRYVAPQPAPERYEAPEQVAVVEIPPLWPDDEDSREWQGDYLPERDKLAGEDEEEFAEEYESVPPRLAQRRAAAARYAAARHAEAERMDRSQQHAIFREVPAITINVPGILDRARGLLGQ